MLLYHLTKSHGYPKESKVHVTGARWGNSDGLNRHGSHSLMCLNAWPKGSGSIRRCVVLLEEVCQCGVGFEVIYTQAMQSVAHNHLLLLADQDVALSTLSLAPCLPVSFHASCHDDSGLNL